MQNFFWLANWPAVDFVNTEIRLSHQRTDLLRTGVDVVDWLRTSGLLDAPTTRGSKGRQLLEAARGYRQVLRNGLEGVVLLGSVPEGAISATNHLLEQTGVFMRLKRGGKGFQLERRWELTSVAEYLAPIALSFAEFLATVDFSRVRRCKNPDCSLFFYDTSKSGTRAWCSLNLCGNKLRIAAYRKRHSSH